MVEPFPSFFDPRFSDLRGGEAYMRAHCARQPLFVFFLHLFTYLIYLVILQSINGEDFCFRAFT